MTADSSNLHDHDFQAAMARAFDTAWSRFLAREGSRADTDDNRKQLAARIVALAKAGQSDEATLAEAAYIYLGVAAETTRLGMKRRLEVTPAGGQPVETAAGEPATRVFAPDTVAAMSAALDLCLDELPFRLPSDALQTLSASILDEAAAGERDPARMQQQALEAFEDTPVVR